MTNDEWRIDSCFVILVSSFVIYSDFGFRHLDFSKVIVIGIFTHSRYLARLTVH